jgi:ribosomal protein L20A (L18A)
MRRKKVELEIIIKAKKRNWALEKNYQTFNSRFYVHIVIHSKSGRYSFKEDTVI